MILQTLKNLILFKKSTLKKLKNYIKILYACNFSEILKIFNKFENSFENIKENLNFFQYFFKFIYFISTY